MKKLGLIGGTGPESTIEYYRQIEYGVLAKAGCFPNLAIESLSVFDVLQFCKEKDYPGLTAYLVRGFQCLADAGADHKGQGTTQEDSSAITEQVQEAADALTPAADFNQEAAE